MSHCLITQQPGGLAYIRILMSVLSVGVGLGLRIQNLPDTRPVDQHKVEVGQEQLPYNHRLLEADLLQAIVVGVGEGQRDAYRVYAANAAELRKGDDQAIAVQIAEILQQV